MLRSAARRAVLPAYQQHRQLAVALRAASSSSSSVTSYPRLSGIATTSAATTSSRADAHVVLLTAEQLEKDSASLGLSSEELADLKLLKTLHQWAPQQQQQQQQQQQPRQRRLLALVGKQAKVTVDTLQSTVSTAVTRLRQLNAKHVQITLPELPATLTTEVAHSAAAQSALLTNYSFDKYISEKDSDSESTSSSSSSSSSAAATPAVTPEAKRFVSSFSFSFPNEGESKSTGDDNTGSQALREEAEHFANAAIFARDLVNERADVCNPEFLHSVAEQLARLHGLTFRALVGEELPKLGLNMHYAVGQASRWAPRLLLLEHLPNAGERPIMLVGKVYSLFRRFFDCLFWIRRSDNVRRPSLFRGFSNPLQKCICA
jgi:leucyl aminopeptidase